MTPLRERARWKWKQMLPLLGVDAKFLSGKHGPCPMCEGRDRWRFDDKEGAGTWICSHCGAGDGVALVMAKNCYDFREAARFIEDLIGGADREPPRTERSAESKREAMNKLWRESEPATNETVAGRYLIARCGASGLGADLRAITRLPYYAERGIRPSLHPGLLAMVRDAQGSPVNIHRTFLDGGGGKAKLPDPRRMMSGDLPSGSAIRLMPALNVLAVAEGIETALSVTMMFGVPCWAAVNAGLLEAWSPPEGVSEVHVYGDNDVNCVGQAAAYALAKRLNAKGLCATAHIPDLAGEDWNDVHVRTRVKSA